MTEDIRRGLKRTWHTFFIRYGRLLPVQEQTIPIVLAEEDALVISGTASGKTEAVMAPLCERLLRKNLSGLSILYITPTRALANDMYNRLLHQISPHQISIRRKTGDSPRVDWKRPPDILITTPESFDSILCRHPDKLHSIEAIVIDEIHILDNTYRGDQLRILLARLRRLSPHVSTYVLSATVPDPEALGHRYMKAFRTVRIPGSQRIHASYLPSLRNVFEMAQKENLKKILIFCNSRRNTEAIAQDAKGIWNPREIIVHHGSLHRRERQESEQTIQQSERVVCISTMTLELGLDIGDIDAVVLADLPLDTSSLIQRIGRAGRRRGITRVIALSGPESRTAFETMITAAKEEILTGTPYVEDLSIIVQQIFSLLYAAPYGLADDEIIQTFDGFCGEEIISGQIIAHLLDTGMIEKRGERLYASEYCMNLGERGKIHSNIPDRRGVVFIDGERNREIGEGILLQKILDEKGTCVLGGRYWDILSVHAGKVIVHEVKRSGSPARFMQSPETGAFFCYLPAEVQKEERKRR